MPTFYFTRKFVESVREFIRDRPELARDVEEFIVRCGRLGLYIIKRNVRDPPGGRRVPDEEGESMGDTIPIYISDKEVEVVKELLAKIGFPKTVIGFYYLCAFNVLMGVWELPPKI